MNERLRLAAAIGRHYLTWLIGGYRPPARAAFKTPERHAEDVSNLRGVLASSAGPMVSRKRGVGHEARSRVDRSGSTLDLRPFNRVLAIDADGETVIVEPQLTMSQLVGVCGRYGLAPAVIPEFPEITIGGAIQGLGAESSSHRWGLFHESVEWMDVVLGNGSALRISATQHPDLFAALPGSYGSLAIITLVKLKLTKRAHAVVIRHTRTTLEDFLGDDTLFDHEFLDAVCDRDFEVVVSTADFDSPPGLALPKYRPTWYGPYYCDHVFGTATETGPEVIDFASYAFRYDRGAFWVAPTKLGRSSASRFFWGGFATAANLYRLRHIKQVLAPSPSTRIVQDCIVPADHAREFITTVRENVSGPLWLLPITSGTENLFGLSPGRWLNVGIYVRPDGPAEQVPTLNRKLERDLARIGGRKTLHADLFYTREDFENVYDMGEYRRLREAYQAQQKLADICEKLKIGDGH